MALRDRRREIIGEIEELEWAAISSQVDSDKICNLKEEYNLLVDEEDELRADRWKDPLTVFPPELWPDILPNTASELLVLTLVCDKWRNIILSVPKLWREVNLIGSREDYLAQAIVCFACSAPLEIDLRIGIPLEAWKEVVSLIAVESSRISSISITGVDEEIKPTEALEMISDLGRLPHLVSVELPYSYSESALTTGVTQQGDITRSIYLGDEALFMRCPSLLNIEGLIFDTEQLRMREVVKLESIHIYSFHRDVVESLGQFPNLKLLRLSEEGHYVANQALPRSLDSSLSSITSFTYRGANLTPALRCMGSNLECIDARYVNMRQLPEILISLQSFPCLYKLSLHIDMRTAEAFTNSSEDAPFRSSITSLFLNFEKWDTGSSEGEGRRRNDDLFRCLAVMMPHIEELNIQIGGYYDAAFAYIWGLQQLRRLYFTAYGPEGDLPPLLFSSGQLEWVSWSGRIPSGGLFNAVRSRTLRNLDLRPEGPFPLRPSDSAVLSPRGRMLTTPIPNLKMLYVQVTLPLAWDLGLFPSLERIGLYGHPYAVLAGDFFEELLLQPGSCPFLEEIGINGDYVEWDLLILLLERRNLATTPGIARIKTIKVGHYISYKLLRPISALLRGKYSHRGRIEEFSSTAMGRMLWNQLVTGCETCLRAFRICKLPVPSILDWQRGQRSKGDIILGMDYPFLLEPLPADPPLSPDVAEWLACRKERRRKFGEGSTEAKKKFYRFLKCGTEWEYHPPKTITSHSLDGAYFEDEAER